MAVPKAKAASPASKYDFLCSFAASVMIVDFLDNDLFRDLADSDPFIGDMLLNGESGTLVMVEEAVPSPFLSSNFFRGSGDSKDASISGSFLLQMTVGGETPPS